MRTFCTIPGALTGKTIRTPRGTFCVVDVSKKEIEAAGYGFHHQSDDGKYLIMSNGMDAFAILVNPQAKSGGEDYEAGIDTERDGAPCDRRADRYLGV